MSQARPLPDKEALSRLLSYDPETGIVSRLARSGPIALSTKSRDGYVRFNLQGRRYSAHRIAWKMHYGRDPASILDHIDRNRSNNRIKNLREASIYLNALNQDAFDAAGFRGYFYDANKSCFRLSFRIGLSVRTFGSFRAEAEARAAYVGAILALRLAGARADGDVSGRSTFGEAA